MLWRCELSLEALIEPSLEVAKLTAVCTALAGPYPIHSFKKNLIRRHSPGYGTKKGSQLCMVEKDVLSFGRAQYESSLKNQILLEA